MRGFEKDGGGIKALYIFSHYMEPKALAVSGMSTTKTDPEQPCRLGNC